MVLFPPLIKATSTAETISSIDAKSCPGRGSFVLRKVKMWTGARWISRWSYISRYSAKVMSPLQLFAKRRFRDGKSLSRQGVLCAFSYHKVFLQRPFCNLLHFTDVSMSRPRFHSAVVVINMKCVTIIFHMPSLTRHTLINVQLRFSALDTILPTFSPQPLKNDLQ